MERLAQRIRTLDVYSEAVGDVHKSALAIYRKRNYTVHFHRIVKHATDVINAGGDLEIARLELGGILLGPCTERRDPARFDVMTHDMMSLQKAVERVSVLKSRMSKSLDCMRDLRGSGIPDAGNLIDSVGTNADSLYEGFLVRNPDQGSVVWQHGFLMDLARLHLSRSNVNFEATW
jgi:hypothetical protein